jgi:hypothetical protein
MLVVTIVCALVLLIAVGLVNGGKDYYKILGLKRTAKEKDIKKGKLTCSPLHNKECVNSMHTCRGVILP